MRSSDQKKRFRPALWVIALIGVIVPRRLRADWRQEWEAELQHREALLANWDRLNWRNKFELLRRSIGAFWDALWMQSYRLEDEIFQDVRFGLRMLRKQPGFTSIAILTLALGIGANTAIFSVVNAVLVEPVPYYEPQRLVWVTSVYEGDELTGASDYLRWRAESRNFDQLVAFKQGDVYLTGRGEPELINCVSTTANLFTALGVAPQLGRAFGADEDRPGGPPVALLSHAFWQRRFGGDPSIIGQTLTVSDTSQTVIGIMPPGFRFLREGRFLGDVEVWLPLALDVQRELKGEMDGGGTSILDNVFGRLKPGSSVEQARSELDFTLRRLEQTEPDRPPGLQVRVTPLGEKLVGHLRLGLLLLFGAAGFVLLIACANVANLTLARLRARQKEMAIRATLGAGRRRLIRQLLTESILLSVSGGVAGLLLAMLGVKALVALTPDDLVQIRDSSVDGVALGFTFLASLVAGAGTGVVPALQTSQINLGESLKDGARSAAVSKRKGARHLSSALVVGQLALTLVLLVGAGLLIQSFLRLRAVEPGYNPDNLLTMMVPLYPAKCPPAQRKFFYREVLTRLNNLPGVQVAATGTPLPLTGSWMKGSFTVVGRPSEPAAPPVEFHEVSVDYFRAMGIQLRAGRSFTEQDNENAPPVAVINDAMARRHFAGEDPVGKHIRHEGSETTIIGVVADVKRYGLTAEVQSEVYRSYLQAAEPLGLIIVVVRTADDPVKWVSEVRQQIRAINADLPIESVKTMEQRLAESMAARRFQMLLFGAFAAVALTLAAVGVYGITSYSVSRRTHEIGIRMALGAQPRDVVLMLVRQGMLLALVGVAIGLAAALALTRLMVGLLFNLKASDPDTFIGISVLLVTVAFLATYLPSRRAAKIEPILALRHE